MTQGQPTSRGAEPTIDPGGTRPFDSLEDLYESAVKAICDAVDQSVSDGREFRVSLSGGSTPKRLYELLSERSLPWEKTHWYWGDERNVPLGRRLERLDPNHLHLLEERGLTPETVAHFDIGF